LLHPGLVDSQNTLFGMSASAVGVVYNTLMIPDLSSTHSATWEQLADDDFRDELAFPCPERSGSASDFLSGFIFNKGESAGWATWETMAEYGMIVPGANAAALESVITGARSILVAGVDWNAYAAINRGEPINFFYPAEGTVVNPRPAMILQTSNNLENAKAFLDYMLTDEAQQMIADVHLIPGRSDVLSTTRPNFNEMTVLNTDWYWMMERSTEISQRFNALMGAN
jgi:iron(III) transport system substrate-binding protein